MIEAPEAKDNKEFEHISIFYPPRKIPSYTINSEEQLLKLAFDLKEKRKTSVEGLLYLVSQDTTKNADDLLSGEKDLVKKEKDNYIKYLIQKHQKWLPTELKKEKLYRRVRRLQTFKPKGKAEKKEKGKDDKEQDKEDLGLEGGSQGMEEVEAEDFEDLEDMDNEGFGGFEDDEYERRSEGGDGEAYY